jgi:hypothetical protein
MSPLFKKVGIEKAYLIRGWESSILGKVKGMILRVLISDVMKLSSGRKGV